VSTTVASKLSVGWQRDHNVAQLDPLELDELVSTDSLSGIGAVQLGEWLSFNHGRIAEVLADTSPEGYLSCLAISRDVGMALATLASIGNNVVPEDLASLMTRVAERTGEPPRDNVYSYTTRNPRGDRLRSFTRTDTEDIFIERTDAALRLMDLAADRMWASASGNNAESSLLFEASTFLQRASQEFGVVAKRITPADFTTVLRPFFEPLLINGRDWHAPGGAQLPMITIDALLYGEGGAEPWKNYVAEGIVYFPPEHQGTVRAALSRPGLTHVALSKAPGEPERRYLLEIVKAILSFRLPHLRVADENFKLRASEALGSGGYRPDVLEMLLDQTRALFEQLNDQ